VTAARAPERARVYLSPPDMGPDERALLLDAFDSGWVAPVGPHLTQFEEEFVARLGPSSDGTDLQAVALSSGTAALHLALQLVGVAPGDEVLVPSLTFIASASPVVYLGARPYFIDAEPRTWNMDPALLEGVLVERARQGRLPKAVVVVDVIGQCADWDPIIDVCARYEIPIVEDAAEALGATYKGRQAGTFGVIGAFSFNGNKTITTGGGGMLVGSAEHVAHARKLATQAREPVLWYEHTELGYNYRLSNLLAAVGLAQLRRLDGIVERQRAINQAYRNGVADLDNVGFMPNAPDGRPTNWLTAVTLGPGAPSPMAVIEAFEAEGLEARPMWKPLHLQPVFAGHGIEGGAVAEAIFDRSVCLPSGSNMSSDDVDRAVACLREVLTDS
jgi:dTDP-4-amino-4,6-dideoxygalactose transaminase